ncbi:MAG TPA: ABC transporter permease [Fimbriimonadaceae bacterium]|nr:ABC transporter permease [Fimbriimonadaceae bacterium]HRE93272.1 ABC transporter permease [Fimbriimonadaceae bacterium]
MRSEFQELWRFRELLFAMVERELKIRYKNSVLGFVWSLLMPLATILVMWLVFKVFLRNDTPNFSAYVLAAYLPYQFIQLAVLDSAQSVLISLPVVKKVYFPREILPLASVISNFIHLLLSLPIFFIFLFVIYATYGFEVSPFTWRMLFLPVLLVITFMLTAGMAFIISALNVFYEDVKYAVSLLLYIFFFLTPVMYFSENVFYALKDKPYGMLLYNLYHANPMAMLVTAYKKTLVPMGKIDPGGGEGLIPMLPMNWPMFGLTVAITLAFFFGGYALFNRMKWRFVERP